MAHGNDGNQNAKKEEPADSWLQVRVTKRQKAEFKERAKRDGLSLSAWVLSQINS